VRNFPDLAVEVLGRARQHSGALFLLAATMVATFWRMAIRWCRRAC
jgi:hypothetical protein